MKKQSLLLLVLSLLFSVSCAAEGDSSSTSEGSEGPRYDAFYRSEDVDLTYYDVSRSGEMDSMIAVGVERMLVIPVMIDGHEDNADEATLSDIEKVMFGDSDESSWESVASFYHKSSYGRLSLTGIVTEWYDCGYTIAELESMWGEPTTIILDRAIQWVKDSHPEIDLTQYDIDQDGHIDGVWMVYSADYSYNSDVLWAYTNWNSANEDYGDASSPKAYTYAWASYGFMYEGYGSGGIDGHTFIHETGHMLSLDDYYDYDSATSPMGMIDMMDNNIIDHNGFSKFSLGWTNPYVVTGEADITLLPASSSGQSILLSADWNGIPFDEYLLIELYTPDGLNEKDALSAYPANGRRGFTIPGVRMYHVDARLFDSGSGAYTDDLSSGRSYIGASNSASWARITANKSKFKLLSLVDAAHNTRYLESSSAIATDASLFKSGSSFAFEDYADAFPLKVSKTMNDGSAFPYTIEFVVVNSQSAQVKIRLS